MRVVVVPDSASLSVTASAAIAQAIRSSEGPRCSVGLSGGSTPKATYEQLRWEGLDWDRVDLWMSDERWVPPGHADSNAKMAMESLVDHIEGHFIRPRWSEYLTGADSAAYYEAELRRIIPDGRADLVLLGMGTDGHTASLFPGTLALEAHDRWFVENWIPTLETWRLTVTPAFLRRAKRVMVLIGGESKAGVLAEVLEQPEAGHPIQLLSEAAGEVVFMADEAAASRLTSTEVERP